jgi:alkylation response protein AidB-like acyl-CoA dehydrogenase
MKASELIQPMTLEEVQILRKLARHPQFRDKAVEVVDQIRAARDQVQQFADRRKAELDDAEKALDIANGRVREAETILAELRA